MHCLDGLGRPGTGDMEWVYPGPDVRVVSRPRCFCARWSKRACAVRATLACRWPAVARGLRSAPSLSGALLGRHSLSWR